MMDERAVNRLILQYLDDLRGIPQSQEDVARHLRDRLRRSPGGAAARGLSYLRAEGYVAPVEGLCVDDEELLEITAAGIRQINRRVPADKLDRMIW